MGDNGSLAERFEAERGRLRGVAYRMLGSLSEADDAVQEAWLRVSRADASGVENMSGWLTTIVARVCLNMLQSRKSRREESLDLRVPDPVVSRPDGTDPEHEALLADSVGLALLVVLETLTPPERLAFVLHDVFAVPFDEIAPIVGRTPDSGKAAREPCPTPGAGSSPTPDADLTGQQEVIDAFLTAARSGDFERLVALLDPDVVLRADGGLNLPGVTRLVRGAAAVAEQALTFSGAARSSRPALVNGAAGLVVSQTTARLRS